MKVKKLVNLNEVHCPDCGDRMPAIRIPDNFHQLMWGGWICPKCKCEMDKYGNKIQNSEK
jgi:hypothetical protein